MWFLAIQQLISRLNQTVLTFIGITLGAMAYVVFSGLMGGYQEFMIDKLISSDAHIRISPRDEYVTADTFKGIIFPGHEIRWLNPPSGRIDYSRLSNLPSWFRRLEEDPRVDMFSPQLIRDVIYTNRKFSLLGRLIGIDPFKQIKVTSIGKNITAGSLFDITKGNSLIVIGEDLMKKLGAKVNDTISVVTASGSITPVKIVGTFRTGMRFFDERNAYASLMTVQAATKSFGEVSDIAVKLHDVNIAGSVADEYASYATDKVESWDQANENILFVFMVQNIVRNSITLIIVLVVAFGIYNVLNMTVNHRKKEIAILRSMGYGQGDIIILFLVQGLILGLLGSLLGLVLGWIACLYIESIEIVTSSKRGWMTVNHMLISWDFRIYVKAFLLITVSSAIASYIPARIASRLSPLEIIRGAM